MNVHKNARLTPKGRELLIERLACGTRSESLGKPPPVGQANRRRASESLDDVPHRLRLASYPADRLPDLYGSLSTRHGIRPFHR